MTAIRTLVLTVALLCTTALVRAEPVSIAAASSLRFALDAILADYAARPGAVATRVVYGSSAKLATQIDHGAPFDLLLAADLEHPQRLLDAGHAVAPLRPFARGQLVLWSPRGVPPTLAGLADTSFKRISIASPAHAPYGQRAIEALRAAGIHDAVEARLVIGENVGQAAQMVASGAADAGLIPLSLLLGMGTPPPGAHLVIGEDRHAPLLHGMVVTRRGAGRPAVHAVFDHLQSPGARRQLAAFGFAPAAD